MLNENINLNELESNNQPISPEMREITATEVASVPVMTAPVQSTQTKAKKGFGKVAVLALCCSLLGGLAGAGGMAAYDGLFRSDDKAAVSRSASKDSSTEIQVGQRDSQKLTVKSVTNGAEMSPADIYEANVNATVGITTSVTTNYWGYQTTAAASGSGFILTSDGYIVTNYHVIEDASSIKVTTYDDTTYTAQLVGYDENNDLAVLKIDATGLQAVVLGDSDALRVGDSVVAIGNPLGELTFSLTHGAVSALNRKVTISNNSMTLIQTDCAINSGNSGGALFNSYGEVIGITNAKYSGSGSSGTASIDNVGFAIPINSVAGLIRSIIEDGYIDKPYIGVSVYDLDSQYQAFGLSGVAIDSVESGSPADKAGLKKNDVITKVNGKEISGTDELVSLIATFEEGEEVTLTIYRQGQTTDVTVTIAIRRQTFLPESQKNSNQSQQNSQFPNGWQGGQNGQGGQGGQNPFGDSENPFGNGQNPFGDGENPFGDGENPFGNGQNPFGDGNFPFSQSEIPDGENSYSFPGFGN